MKQKTFSRRFVLGEIAGGQFVQLFHEFSAKTSTRERNN